MLTKEQPENKSTLSAGQYTIEFTNGPSNVYKIDGAGNKVWICSTSDPEYAMTIIEGLILVEYKRFYHPDSKPQIHVAGTEIKDEKPILPFLQSSVASPPSPTEEPLKFLKKV